MIEIPGYRIVRPLGQGSVASVHLAVQNSIDREVVLKILAPSLLVDPQFADRFVREAKLAARLRHRHIIDVFDAGRVGDHHFIAMEYMAGGSILRKDGQLRPLAFVLRVIDEIADALAFIHERGLVHCDVKTENILLRADGSAAIVDFGAAWTGTPSPNVAWQAIIGTPRYMSPEQSMGAAIDGRSDLYSLGIVFHELLTGGTPFAADDSTAEIRRHRTEPVPCLEPRLAMLQPIIDGLLAKQPGDRFASASLLRDMLAKVAGLAAIDRSQVVVSMAAIGAPAVGEPHVGSIEGLDVHGTPAHRLTSMRRHRRMPLSRIALPVVAIILAVVLWVVREPLRDVFPGTEMNRLLAQGQRALFEGRILGAPDAALESFRRARELEPDNEVARAGLSTVASRLLEAGDVALRNGDLELATQKIAIARELQGGGASIDEISRRLEQAELLKHDEQALLESADVALAEGRLLGDAGAIDAFRKLQQFDPQSAIARAGLQKAVEMLAAEARRAAGQGDAAALAQRIDDIAGVLPDFADLATLRGQLAAMLAASQAVRDQLLMDAQAQLRAGNVSGADDSAMALYLRILGADPGNHDAREGLRRVGIALLVRVDAALEGDDLVLAERLLREVATVAPTLPELAIAKARLRDIHESRLLVTTTSTVDTGQRQRAAELVLLGDAALQRGALMDPPGTSAYDYYRKALAIDAAAAGALAGLAKLPDSARRRFDDRLAVGEFSAAAAEIEILRQLAAEPSDIDERRRRLAVLCRERAARRIDGGLFVDARRDIDLARRLDDGNPAQDDLERHLVSSQGR